MLCTHWGTLARQTKARCQAFPKRSAALVEIGLKAKGQTVINPDLIDLAMRMVQEGADPAGGAQDPTQQEPTEVAESSPIASAGLSPVAPVKDRKTAEELAAMILHDLSQIDGCPKSGMKVTVYGSNPWNSWLSFGGDAGPVRNKSDVQAFCGVITERLKRLYDVSA